MTTVGIAALIAVWVVAALICFAWMKGWPQPVWQRVVWALFWPIPLFLRLIHWIHMMTR